MKRHLDRSQVVTAVAHKLARIFYSMLVNGTKYNAEQQEHDPEKARQRAIRRLQRTAKQLGMILVDPDTGEMQGVAL